MQIPKLYFVGTAGSGKTTMVKQFRRWMNEHGYDALTINLDPGAEELPYEPEIDIREWVTLAGVMEEHGLGPNGAQIACADLLATKIGEVREIMDGLNTDYFLIDTPGQIELFAFRESSRFTVDALGQTESAIAFLFDPFLSKTPSGYISNLLLAATVQFRFYVPSIYVLSKADQLGEEALEQVLEWSREHERLLDAVVSEAPSMSREVSIEFLRGLSGLGASRALFPVSSKEMTGFEDLYNSVQQTFAGGEDIER